MQKSARSPASLQPTIYHEDWWLDIVTEGRYAEVTVEAGGSTVGRMPYSLQRWLGHNVCGMPGLAHFLGPGVDEGGGNPCTRALRRKHITQELLGKLPRAASFFQRMHRGVTDTLAFQEQGYHTGVTFTHEIAPAAEAQLWSSMRDKTRNVIRRARDGLDMVALEPQEFTAFYTSNLRARRQENYMFKDPVAVRLGTKALEMGRGSLIGTRTRAGHLTSAVFHVWDHASAYLFLITRGACASNGDTSLLVWHAMQDASRRGLTFDMDGVGSPGSALFYTGFGGEIRPRFIVTRATLSYRVAKRAALLASSGRTRLTMACGQLASLHAPAWVTSGVQSSHQPATATCVGSRSSQGA